jgi:hypothetical protein
MSTVLLLLGVVGSAYLLTHFVVERAQQRFLFVSGVEYVLLGVVLSPAMLPQFQPLADLTRLAPVFAFAAGWVGLLQGLEPRGSAQSETGGQAIWHAVVDTLATGTLVTAAARWAFGSPWLGLDSASSWSAALLLGCTAAAGSSSAIDLLQSRYRALTTHLLPLLRQTTWYASSFAILGFGLVFCLFHQGHTLGDRPVEWWGWALLTLGLGIVLGLLFWMFIGASHDDNSVFLAMVGILLFASGAAFFLNLSPLLVNLVLGLVLAQTPQGRQLHPQLVRTAGPARLVLLLFAGAHWRPVPLLPLLAVVLGYLALRLLGRVVSSAIATLGTPLRLDLFRGGMAQGDVAVAMALSFRLVYEGLAVDLAYTTVLVGVVVHEIVSPRMLRGLLVDAGELREDLGPRQAEDA